MMQSDPLVPEDSSENPDSNNTPSSAIQSRIGVPPSIFEGRLHPLTLVFGLMKGSRGLLPVIPLMLFGNRSIGFGLVVVIFGMSVLSVFWRYFSFSYRIEGHDLITQHGIVERKQRHIPLERIQEIRIDQGIVQRAFGVVEARVETGSGGGAEATLSVLSRDDAENLRRAVFERVNHLRAGVSDEQVPDMVPEMPQQVIRRIGVFELALAGITSNHIVSAMILAGALWNFADDILPDTVYERAANIIYRTTRDLLSQDVLTAVLMAVAGLSALFVIGMVFSVLGSIFLFHGFTFARRDEDLHRSYGLLTKRTSSLPRRRIQVLKIEQKILRRLCGLATLRADTSGAQREGRDDNQGRDVLLPIVRLNEVDRLLPFIFPDIPDDSADWQHVSRLAIRRGAIKGGLVCLVLAGLLFVRSNELASLWPLLFLPAVYFVSAQNYRHLGYAMGNRYFRTRRGWLGRATHIVPINKIQSVEIRQTPFDRRLGLATLSVDTAGQAYTDGGPMISNLPIIEARHMAAVLAHKAAQLRYSW